MLVTFILIKKSYTRPFLTFAPLHGDDDTNTFKVIYLRAEAASPTCVGDGAAGAAGCDACSGRLGAELPRTTGPVSSVCADLGWQRRA